MKKCNVVYYSVVMLILCIVMGFVQAKEDTLEGVITVRKIEDKKEPVKEPEKAKVEKPEKPEKKEGEIVFGSNVCMQSGGYAACVSFADGIRMRVEESRREGGIHGLLPKVIIEDDDFEAEKARKIVLDFVKKGITKLLCPTGDQTIEAYLDLVTKDKLLLLFPSAGSYKIRNKNYPSIITWRSSNWLEGQVLAEYCVNELKTKKGIIFHEDAAFGWAVLNAAKSKLKQLGKLDDWLILAHESNKTKFDEQIKQAKEFDFDTIIFSTTPNAAQEFIRQIGAANLAGKHMLGNSDFADEVFLKFIKDKGLKFINLSTVPNPETSDLEIVKQFRQEAKKVDKKIGPFELEAYIQVDIAFFLIGKIEGGITNEKIIKQAQSIKDLNYKGLPLNFNPDTNELSRTVWINTGDPEYKAVTLKDEGPYPVFDKEEK